MRVRHGLLTLTVTCMCGPELLSHQLVVALTSLAHKVRQAPRVIPALSVIVDRKAQKGLRANVACKERRVTLVSVVPSGSSVMVRLARSQAHSLATTTWTTLLVLSISSTKRRQ
jgi:hypothetical protein